MTEINLKGIFAPIPTPFSDGKVAHEQLAANVNKWRQTGLRGLVVQICHSN
jgi:dihydrodipicolinate synthase/N-acetylneuraminate lyase